MKLQYVAQLQVLKVENKTKSQKGFSWLPLTSKTKIQLLINPTKTPKTDGNNLIFKLQKATQLQVLKGRMQNKISKKIVMVAIEVKKLKSNN